MAIKDTLFVQFYNTHVSGGKGTKIFVNNEYVEIDRKMLSEDYFLSNGFSSMYHRCKELGDFYWVRLDLSGSLDELQRKNSGIELPIDKGKVYISAFFNFHMYMAYVWAMRYPNIEFVVGGTAVEPEKLAGEIPLISPTLRGLWEVIGGERSWGVEIPKGLNGKVLLGYTVEEFCYWAKCNFCTYPGDNTKIKFDPNFVNDLNDGYLRVFLNSPALSPKFLKTYLPQLKPRNDIDYWTHLRCDTGVFRVLESTFKECQRAGFNLAHFCPLTGLEFPSNRMLAWMKKGHDLDIVLRTFELYHKYRLRPAISLIFGWANLTAEDIKEAREFLFRLSDVMRGRVSVKCHSLAAKVNTDLYKDAPEGTTIRLGPFELGRILELDSEQQELNSQYREVLMKAGFLHLVDMGLNPENDFL